MPGPHSEFDYDDNGRVEWIPEDYARFFGTWPASIRQNIVSYAVLGTSSVNDITINLDTRTVHGLNFGSFKAASILFETDSKTVLQDI
jgi:hypothetical protein